MSKKMTTPKSKSAPSAWTLCEKCSASISAKETEQHLNRCPPNLDDPGQSFILNNILYGKVDTKSTDVIKGLTEEQKDGLVFMSQSAMRLCGIAIGDAVLVTQHGEVGAFVGNAWPTAEKSILTVLLTKNAMDSNALKNNMFVSVKKHKTTHIAKLVHLVITNGPKAMEITNELKLRLKNQFIGRSITESNCLTLLYFGKQLKLQVKSITADIDDDLSESFSQLNLAPSNYFHLVTDKTQVLLYKDDEQFKSETKPSQYKLSTLGGLKNEIEEIQTLLENALICNKKTFIKPCKGVLLFGQSGTGKTHLAKALANSLSTSIVEINSTDLYSKYSGNMEENLKKLFQEARKAAPCIILMDEIELLCANRSLRITESEKRIVSCILNELDMLLNDAVKVLVLGTTNRLDGIDAAFRRCGRFDREIEIPIPNPIGRLEILKILLDNNCDESTLKQVAYDTHGFVGADLISLCSTAATHCTQEALSYQDFKFALTKVRPSAMREVQIEVPNVKWSDIGGQQRLKLILRQCVEWPLKHADSFLRLGIKPPRGVLMYGPPGCSKTMIAKALATESGLNFLSIKGPELFSKWVGESEKAIRDVFRRARQVAPSIIFFDEIDALGGERSASGGSSSVQERVLAQLLTELDGVSSLGDVTILAATNRPDRIDNALLRPGRLDRIVYVPLPDEGTRRDIFRIQLDKMPVEGVDVDGLVARTEGYSGAEINAVCHEAAMMALEEDLAVQFVRGRHFDDALNLITPRTPASLVAMYDEYKKK